MPDTSTSSRRSLALGTRWLGAGLAAAVAVVTLGLTLTGQIGLYINPDAAWWAVAMSVVVLVGAVVSCAIPISGDGHGHADDDHAHDHAPPRRSPISLAVTVVGGVIASALVLAAVVLPPASLSAEIALARAAGGVPQLSSSSTLQLASSGDTSDFGIGDWAAVLATTTDPAAYVGTEATLTGFVGKAEPNGGFDLTRLVVVHCVIDAQTASVPVTILADMSGLDTGAWVEVDGVFTETDGGALVFEPSAITPVDEPEDPYEY